MFRVFRVHYTFFILFIVHYIVFIVFGVDYNAAHSVRVR